MPFSSRFPTIIPIIIINPLNSKEMNNKKKNEGRTDFSYYGLYLLDYLTTNKFEQAADEAFIRERTDRAAEAYEQARLEGYPADGAQELAMNCLLYTSGALPYKTLGKKTYYSEEDVLTFLSEHVKNFRKEDIAFYKARIHKMCIRDS